MSNMLDRRNFLKAVGLRAALALPGCTNAANALKSREPKLPNVVFIMADDMGYGDVGVYNPESKIPTPNMDRLAKEGVRFTDAHSPSAVCSPTRYGVLTGRYCWRTRLKRGVLSGFSQPLISRDQMTVAEVLKRHGYRTACIGKWHLGVAWQSKDGEPITSAKDAQRVNFDEPLTDGPKEHGFDYSFITAACSTVDQPYVFIENGTCTAEPTAKMVRKGPVTTTGSRTGARGDMVVLVDWCVGQVVETLDRLKLADDTLVIVTSDNGPRIGEKGHQSAGHWRGYKSHIWEGGHRIPFIARWPGRIKPDTTSNELICLTDLMATCADIVGARLPETAGQDSYNILPALLGKKLDKPIREAIVHHSVFGVFGIRRGQWKLILETKGSGGWVEPSGEGPKAGSPGQLYNLADDPREQNDLWDRHPEIVDDLTKLLEKYMKEGRSRPL